MALELFLPVADTSSRRAHPDVWEIACLRRAILELRCLEGTSRASTSVRGSTSGQPGPADSRYFNLLSVGLQILCFAEGNFFTPKLALPEAAFSESCLRTGTGRLRCDDLRGRSLMDMLASARS